MDISKRFWSKVDKSGECWLWKSSCFKDGYGQFFMMENGIKKNKKAHRVSYAMTMGEIGNGLLVLHRCDNRKCVNPSHLFLGTNIDNMKDMVLKGRQVKGIRNMPNAIISLSQAQEIREKYLSGGYTQKQLGIEYGLCKSSIGNIVRGLTYNQTK